MGPVRQNPIQRNVRSVHIVCAVHCTIIVAHNTAQNRPDNFPSCPPDNHHCSDDVYLREREELKFIGVPKLANRSLPLVGRSSSYYIRTYRGGIAV